MKDTTRITMFRSAWALALAACLLAPGVAAAQISGTPRSTIPALHDGVVVDAARGAAYVMTPQGIDALELATGNVLWKSRDAAKPLLATEGALLAQVQPRREGELVLVALDPARGTVKSQTAVALPAGLRAQVVDGPSTSFRAEAFRTAAGEVIVTWSAEDGQSLQGLLPPSQEGATPVHDTVPAGAAAGAAQALRGAVRLDLATGGSAAVPYETAQTLRTPTLAGTRPAVGAEERQLASLDGRYVLHSERNPGGGIWTSYRWTVTDAAGKTLGTLEMPVSMAPFIVSSSQLFYVAQPAGRKEGNRFLREPLRLRALDLRSGVELWTAPVVDAVYRGPFPP